METLSTIDWNLILIIFNSTYSDRRERKRMGELVQAYKRLKKILPNSENIKSKRSILEQVRSLCLPILIFVTEGSESHPRIEDCAGSMTTFRLLFWSNGGNHSHILYKSQIIFITTESPMNSWQTLSLWAPSRCFQSWTSHQKSSTYYWCRFPTNISPTAVLCRPCHTDFLAGCWTPITETRPPLPWPPESPPAPSVRCWRGRGPATATPSRGFQKVEPNGGSD